MVSMQVPLIPRRPSHPVAMIAIGFQLSGAGAHLIGNMLDNLAEVFANAAFRLDQLDFAQEVKEDINTL